MRIRKSVASAIRIVAIATGSLILTSCLDVLQTIETTGNSIETTIRFTFSKSLIEGAAAMSGEEPDYSDLPDFSGDDGFVNIDVPGVRVESREINTESDIGTEVSFTYPQELVRSLRGEDAYFLPVVDRDRVQIMLPPNDDAGEMDEMTAMFFGSARYRILINRDGRAARDVLVDGRPGRAVLRQAGAVSYVEIPLSLWFQATKPLLIEILY